MQPGVGARVQETLLREDRNSLKIWCKLMPWEEILPTDQGLGVKWVTNACKWTLKGLFLSYPLAPELPVHQSRLCSACMALWLLSLLNSVCSPSIHRCGSSGYSCNKHPTWRSISEFCLWKHQPATQGNPEKRKSIGERTIHHILLHHAAINSVYVTIIMSTLHIDLVKTTVSFYQEDIGRCLLGI